MTKLEEQVAHLAKRGYVHSTILTGFADVIRDGIPTRITHGDPEFDAINARMNEHLRSSLIDDSTDTPPDV